MLGLRSNGRFAGATRLLDEWITGLEPFWSKGPRTIDHAVAEEIFGAAAARVRKFARKGAALEPVTPDASGLMRFELQGYDYVARAQHRTLCDLSAVDGIEQALREGLASVLPALAAEEQGIFALVLAPSTDTPIATAAWVDALAALRPTAIAWAFPDAHDPFGGRAVSETEPGLCLMLAWSQDPVFNDAAVER